MPTSAMIRRKSRPVLDDASIGRIEAWVVSTLEVRSKAPAEGDGLSSALRAPRVRTNDAGQAPTPQGAWARFRLSRRRGIAVVSLTDQALVKEDDLAELTGDLRALLEAGHRRLVLDFFAVERLSSWAARAIDEVARRFDPAEGACVKFSGLRPEVSTIFAMTGLDPRVACYPDSASAIGGDWPELPELRPLPVSILEALMRAEATRAVVEDRPIMPQTARLIIQDGPSMGRAVSVKGPRFVIGRGPNSDLRVGSALVSRSHATIERRGNRLILRDLASTNGTLLNGRAVRDRAVELIDGDQIQIGKLSMALAFGRGDDSSGDFEGDLAPISDDSPDETCEDLGVRDLVEQLRVKFEVIENTLVVTPLASELDSEEEIDALRDALVGLMGRRMPRRVVVNLSHVGHLSGRAIGVLVAHHLRLDRSGGALRICLANPRVAVLLEQVKLGMLVDYHPTVEEAVIAAWPGLAVSASV